MNLNLSSYVQNINFLSYEECQSIISELERKNVWREYPYNSPKDNICVKENPTIPYYDCRLPESHWISQKIQSKVKEATDQYIKEFLHDFTWFSYWTGNSKAHYIKYPKGTGMETHCDHVRNQFDGSRRGIPLLSLLVMLNDNYKGGNLLFWEQNEIKPAAGNGLIFPSNFLYPHKVQEVTEGTRYSFIIWIW